MSRALLVIIAVAVLGGGLFIISDVTDMGGREEVEDSTLFSNWPQYQDLHEKFSIKLPTPPEHVAHTMTDPKTNQLRSYNIYASKSLDGTVYMVSELAFSGEIDSEKDIQDLKDVVSEMVATKTTNRLKSMKETTFHGVPAVEFQILSNDNLVINGIAFSKNNMLYTLSSIGNLGQDNLEEFKNFADSFTAKNSTIQPPKE